MTRIPATVAVCLAVLVAACLYTPPRQLPSSIRLLYSKTSHDSLGARVDVYFLVAREGNELRLTGGAGEDRDPVFAPGLRKVFFTRRIDDHDEIWSMDLDGSGQAAVLSASDAEFRDPAVSPDGATIAFTRALGGREEVWTAGVEGSGPRALVVEGGPWRRPAWSPDGRTLAVVGGAEAAARVYLVGASGGAPRPLAPAEVAPQRDPAWSPDGKRIAFARGSGNASEIVVAEAASGAVTRLTDDDVEDVGPSWSPDGDRIAYVSRRPGGRWNLWLMDPDGKNREALTRYERDDARDPDWL